MFAAVLFILGTNSCTVTKRLHRKGWHVSWNTNKSSDSQSKETSDKQKYQAENLEVETTENVTPKESEFSETALDHSDLNPVKDKIAQEKHPDYSPKEVEPEIDKIEKEAKPDNKKWHYAVPIITMGLGLSGAVTLTLISGWITLLIPFGFTIIAGLITLISIRKNRYASYGQSPKDKIFNMIAIIALLWGVSAVIPISILSQVVNITILCVVGFLMMLILFSLNESVKSSKEENQTGVNSDESHKDTPEESQSNYEGFLAGAIFSFAFAGALFLIGLLLGALASINTGFAIPEMILLSTMALFILGFVLIAIYVDKKTSHSHPKRNKSKERNKKRDTIGMIIIFLGVVTMIVLAVLH